MNLAEIKFETDGGPWVEHNMPCAVCQIAHAVYELGEGFFHPCWSCQKLGWKLFKKKQWFWKKASK